ncbi:hypothetical protein D3C87_1655050 [compost metagenome]
MTVQDLALHLQELEEQLFKLEIRNSREKLEKLLSPDFYEIGRSGTSYSYGETVASLLAEESQTAVRGDNYELRMLSDGAALLIYRTTRTAEGSDPLLTLRSSIWRKEAEGNWRMVFHQGTPAATPSDKAAEGT